MTALLYGAAAWLLVIGLYGVVTSRHLVHLVLCLAVAQSSSYLLLIGIGYRAGGIAPYYADRAAGTPAVDPIVQALVLTDIVVGATVMALLLALALQVQKDTGSFDPRDVRPMRG